MQLMEASAIYVSLCRLHRHAQVTWPAVVCIGRCIFGLSYQVSSIFLMQPSSTLAHINSDILVLLLSPLIIIHICCIFTQDLHFIIQGKQPLTLFLRIHATRPFSAQPTTRLSSSAQFPRLWDSRASITNRSVASASNLNICSHFS